MRLMEKTQKQIVLDLLKKYGKMRTEEVKDLALNKGIMKSMGSDTRISCSDRHLRTLWKEGLVVRYRCIGDRTKTWDYVRCPAKEVVNEKTISESTRKRIAVQMSLSEADLKNA